MRAQRPLVALSTMTALVLSMLSWSGASPAPASATTIWHKELCAGALQDWTQWQQWGRNLVDDDVLQRDTPSHGTQAPWFADMHRPASGPGSITENDTVEDTSQYLLYTPPAHAESFDLHADGAFDYVPDDGYMGGDTFQYVMSISGWCSRIATVTLLAPTAPRLIDDTFTVFAGEVFDPLWVCGEIGQCGVLANDWFSPRTDPLPGPPHIFGVKNEDGSQCYFIGLPDGTSTGEAPCRLAHGTATVRTNGRFVYTPDAGFVGQETFYYTARDPACDCLGYVSGRVTLDVVARPASGVAVDDGPIAVTEDTALTIGAGALLGNDSGLNLVMAINNAAGGTPSSVRTSHGTLQIAWTPIYSGCTSACFDLKVDSVIYTPDPDFNGRDSFTYVALQSYPGLTSPYGSAKVVLDVLPVEDPPTAGTDTASIKEDTSITMDLLANDTDPDGDLDPSSLRADPCTDHICPYWQRHGSWVFNGDGTVTFTPDPEFTGPTGLDYLVSDATGNTALGKVQMTVLPDAAVDDDYTTIEDTGLSVPAPGVLGNDDPPASGPATASPGAAPDHGSVDLSPDGSFDYTPDPDFAGTDAFTYVGPDGDTGVVTIEVAPVNDPPVVVLNAACVDDAAAGIFCIGDRDDRYADEGQAVQLRGSVEDAELSPGVITIDWGDGTSEAVQYPCSPEGCLTSEPTWYDACGLFGACGDRLFFDLQHVYADGPAGRTPAFTISVVATETNGPSSSPASGVAMIANVAPAVTLAPHCTVSGGIFCLGAYSVLDVGVGESVRLEGRVADPGIEPVTIVIDWGDGSTTTIEADCSTVGAPCPSEPLQPTIACLLDEAGCGWFLATHLYTGVSGAGGFAIQVEATDADGESGSAGTIAHVIDPPPVVEGFEVSTDEDTAVDIDLAAHASDTVTPTADLSFSVTADPGHGTLTGAGSSLSYQPTLDLFGPDSFEYEACDELGQCSSATVTITVDPVNDGPQAGDDAVTTDEDVPVTIAIADLLGNDSDVDDTLAATGFSILTGPAHGTLTEVAGGVRYTPDDDWFGSDGFTYEICDAAAACATATVGITVDPINDAPMVTVSGPASIAEGAEAGYTFTVSDVDPSDTFEVAAGSPSCGGGTLVPGSVVVGAGGGSFRCAFADGPASQTISVAVVDAVGAPDADDTDTAVTNVAPAVTIQSVADGQAFVPVEFELGLEATFTDPGDDTHSATVAWGDGAVSSLVSVSRSGFGASHAYGEPGTFTITVTITDSDGATDVSIVTVDVVDTAQAIEGAAVQLLSRVGDASPDAAILLQRAVDDLIGANDGTATNGALDSLEAGDPLTAVNKLYAVEVTLDGIVDLDVSAQQAVIAQTARVITVQTVGLAKSTLGCDPIGAGTCSRGERKAISAIEDLIAGGDVAYTGTDYVGAVDAYLKAVKKTVPLL